MSKQNVYIVAQRSSLGAMIESVWTDYLHARRAIVVYKAEARFHQVRPLPDYVIIRRQLNSVRCG